MTFYSGASSLRRRKPISYDESNCQGALFDDLPKYETCRLASELVRIALLNPLNREILDRMPSLNLAEWWLTSGCLFQTVWNVLTGLSPTAGILDYDIFYYDADLSWEAEDDVIRKIASKFSDLKANIEVRNQARVHLWYEQKFGIKYPPLRAAHHAVRRFPCRASAVALTKLSKGEIIFYAPFGLTELMKMKIQPNPRLPIADVYIAKSERWVHQWPSLAVEPWSAGEISEGLRSSINEHSNAPQGMDDGRLPLLSPQSRENH